MAALAGLHEPTPDLRDRTPGAPSAWRVFGVTTLLSAFVAASGAFGVGAISPGLRFPLVIGLGGSLSLLGLAVTQGLGRVAALKPRPRLRTAASVLAGLVLACLLCWAVARALEGARTPGLLQFAWPAALFMATVAAIDVVARAIATPRRKAGPPASGLAARLPRRLRGAAILALQGEDHYVRVHTSAGEHLVWMRLTDAMSLLDGLDGRQTHRSWWVARGAVLAVKRGNGRAVLTLSTGRTAPVSRRFAASLRADGWY